MNGAVSAAIELACADGAESSDRAVIVGDHAGIVEWANAAWSEITGYPLVDTVHKPITHFLEAAQIELELVDFVGQHFLEGRPCILEFPFETFDQRQIQVHLEVQPIQRTSGEPSAFMAVASVIPRSPPSALLDQGEAPTSADRFRVELAQANPATIASNRETTHSTFAISLSSCVLSAGKAAAKRRGDRVYFDLGLAADLPPIDRPAEPLKALTQALIEAGLHSIGDDWGCLTVLTGIAPANRSHISAVHPVVARPDALKTGPHLFLEVHDTGPCLGIDPFARSRAGRDAVGLRETALARAFGIAEAQGFSLYVDATPGCGNQSLVLIPIR